MNDILRDALLIALGYLLGAAVHVVRVARSRRRFRNRLLERIQEQENTYGS